MDKVPDTAAELKARALRYLVRREHSRAELARKLAPHAESHQAVATLIESLVSKNQLSDERFAEERARVLSRKYGPAKIRQDLRGRGIEEEVIERTLSGNEIDRAREILKKKFPAQTAERKELARRARFLQGRGFSYEIVMRLLSSREPD